MSTLAPFARWSAVAIALVCAGTAAAQNTKKNDGTDQAIGSLAASLTKAFNAHDSEGIAGHWQEDGVHRSSSTGDKLEGRKAILNAYRKLFAADPKSQLALRVNSVRKLSADVVSADCVSAVRHTDGQVTRSSLSAVLVRRDGDWWISQVDETDLPEPQTAEHALVGLDWLVGHWTDEADDLTVSNNFNWSHNGRFLTQQFRVLRGDEQVRGGTQMFGWDPVKREIRVWTFLDDGAYGEGVCTREAKNKWVTKLALTLSDGKSGSLTQVIEQVGDDHFTIQSVDREVEGAAQPNAAVVTMQRNPDPIQASEAGGGGQGGGGGFF